MTGSADKLPVPSGEEGARDGDVRGLYIENLHYHPNDMSEIRRMAEIDPSLAHNIIDANREAVRLMDGSFRLGLFVAGGLGAVGVIGTVAVVISLGWLQALGFTIAILAVGHLLRVVLTGEWSDTSWIGKLIGPKEKDP